MRSDWVKAARRRAVVPVLVLIAGLVIVVAGNGLIGWTVFSVGLTLVIALVFLEIGYSEDRAREAERRNG